MEIRGLDGLNVPESTTRMNRKEPTTSVQVRRSVQKRLALYALQHDERLADVATKAISEWLDNNKVQ